MNPDPPLAADAMDVLSMNVATMRKQGLSDETILSAFEIVGPSATRSNTVS